jgi:hypothetical protein
VTGGVQMAQALAASTDVQACVATQMYRYSFGSAEAGPCSTSAYATAFSNNNQDMRELLFAIVSSSAFSKRAVPTQ